MISNISCYRKEGKDSEYENVETEEDERDTEQKREEEEIRRFEEEELLLMAKGMVTPSFSHIKAIVNWQI